MIDWLFMSSEEEINTNLQLCRKVSVGCAVSAALGSRKFQRVLDVLLYSVSAVGLILTPTQNQIALSHYSNLEDSD